MDRSKQSALGRWAQSLILILGLGLGGWAATAEPLDQGGKSRSWKGERDTYTVIDFAAQWCAPCWKVLPKFQELADRFPAVRFLVVSVDEDEAGRDKLVQELGLTLPVLWDEGYAIAEHYKPKGMPSTFVIDPQGKVVYQHTGSADSVWRELVEFVRGIAPLSKPPHETRIVRN